MVSRLECTRVHFVQVSVSVSRPEVQGLGLVWRPEDAGLWSRCWSQDSMLGAYACSTSAVICSTFKRVLCHHLELMQPVLWSRDRPWSRNSSALEFILSRSRSWSRDLKTQVSVLVSRTDKRSWQQHWRYSTFRYTVTLKPGLGSLRVIGSATCDFELTFHCAHGPRLYRTIAEIKDDFSLKSQNVPTPCISRPQS